MHNIHIPFDLAVILAVMINGFFLSPGDGEDKARHLKAARREQLLVMRLTTKEQELHELAVSND